jgi:hypothetical protein
MNLEGAHALVVGISAYQHVRPLPQAEDARNVAALRRGPSRRCRDGRTARAGT